MGGGWTGKKRRNKSSKIIDTVSYYALKMGVTCVCSLLEVVNHNVCVTGKNVILHKVLLPSPRNS